MNWLLVNLTDRAVVGGLVLLILATPLCFGTVHPWAYHKAETLIFASLAAALSRMRAAHPASKGSAAVLRIAAPAAFLATLIVFQLIPLPPPLLHVLSPSTYKFYEHALDGWPTTVNYPKPEAQPATLKSQPVVLPPESTVGSDGAIPFSSERRRDEAAALPIVGHSPADAGWYGTRLRSLSLAPPLTLASALQLFAAFGLFVIVALYPITPEANRNDEDPLTRLLVAVILISGFVVASVGLVQQATWNGKVLWFFVPLDWHAPKLGRQRMLGPFIDPDHFAAYLAMTVPLFISRTWNALAAEDGWERKETAPILCCGGLAVVLCAIVLSESRAIWAGLVLASLIFAFLTSPTRKSKSAGGARAWGPRLGLAVLAIAALSISLIGSAGRGQVDARVGQSVNEGLGFWFRVQIWRDTLRMVRDYPLLGVGLGAWPEVFPHYQGGTWPPMWLRNAHNDYVEAAAELGILGVAAIALIVWRVSRLARCRWSSVSPRAQLTMAALVAGTSVEAFHELFDFSLIIPAIGFLFAIYAALIVRIAIAGAPETEPEIRTRGLVMKASPYAAAAAGMLAIASAVQASVIYPYYPLAKTFDAARTLVLLHPANASLHLGLSSWYRNSPIALAETARAVWIDPRNPFARDLYAYNLLENGHPADALNQVTISVMHAPSSGDHLYLNPRIVPYLAPPDLQAIEHGLLEAIARGSPEAVETLGAFYVQVGRSMDAALTYEHGAVAEEDPGRRLQLLMTAGQTYASAGQLGRARSCYDRARALWPDQPEPYSAILTQVFAPQKNLSDAEAVLKEGLEAGADPAPLLAAFAQVAQASGQPDKAREALVKMVDYAPTYENLLQLGSFYAAAREYTRAFEVFRRATDVDPENPRAWFQLASSEDAAYQYVAADHDYSRASGLDPSNHEMRATYAAFKRKLAAPRADSMPGKNAAIDSTLSN